jgi:hypothetical protein
VHVESQAQEAGPSRRRDLEEWKRGVRNIEIEALVLVAEQDSRRAVETVERREDRLHRPVRRDAHDRVERIGIACTAPSPRISIIGETATFTPEEAPVSRAILPLKYEVPTPPAGPVPSALPTTRGTRTPI